MAEHKDYGLIGVGRNLQFGKQGPVLVGNADTDTFTVTMQDGATLTTMGGANATDTAHFITKAQLDVVYTEATFKANVNYNDSSPILLGNITSGTKTIITTLTIGTAFDDANAVVTIGTSANANLLMSDNYCEIEVNGVYQTVNIVEFANNTSLNIYVTQASATAGAGNVLVSVVDGPVVDGGTINYGSSSGNYGNSNVVTLLSSFGSNSISTIGNISANAFVLPGGGTITESTYGFAGSIRLKPIGGSATQYLEIAPTAGGDGDHVHLMAGGGTTELFLGDDNQYVKLASNGAIVVNSANVSLGNSAQWTFGIDGNLTLPGNSFTVNYANGSQVSLGGGGIALANLSVSVNSPSGNGSLSYSNTTGVFTFTPANLSSVAGNYGNSNVVTLLSSFGSNSISTTGNVTANNLIGNISITGNVTGTSQNVSLVAGSFTATFDNTGILTLPRMGGDEGGEINFGVPATNTTLSTRVVLDVYQDRIRFFDGNTKGAYIDLSQAGTGVSTLLNNRVAAFVNAGTFVTMDLIKATVTTSGNRGLSLATTTGTLTYNIGGTYGWASGATSGGFSVSGQSLTTTPTTAIFGWSFPSTGDTSTYILTDTTNSRAYRITLQIGGSFNNNMISIERLI